MLPSTNADKQKYWYAVHSHPNKEQALAQLIGNRGVEYYLPCQHVKPVNPRMHTWRAYFPGYLFVHVNLGQYGRSLFQFMPYSSGLVTFGDEPAVVPDAIIEHLEHLLEHRPIPKPPPDRMFHKGDSVQIIQGPLAGYSAIFDLHLDGRERVRVLLNCLNDQTIAVELNTQNIRRPD